MLSGDAALRQAEERIRVLERELRRAREMLAGRASTRAGPEGPAPPEPSPVAALARLNRDLRRQITERERVEDALRGANRVLTTRSGTDRVPVRGLGESALLSETCRSIVEVGGYRLAWVGFVEGDAAHGITLVAQAGADPGRHAAADAARAGGLLPHHPAGMVIHTGRPAVVRDAPSDPADALWRGDTLRHGCEGIIGLPLTENERTFGVLSIHSSLPHPFSVQEVRLLEDLAEELSRGIVALRARAERRRAMAELRLDEARLEALLTLNQMADASVAEIAHYTMEQAVQLTGSTLGYLAFVNCDESVMTMYAWSRQAMRECRMADRPLVYPVETTGLWGEAVRQRRPIITNNYGAPSPLKRGYPEGHVALRRHLNVPVMDGDHVVAVIGVGNKDDEYADADGRQLQLLGGGMWRILEGKRTLEELRASEEKYRSLFAVEPDALVLVDVDTIGIVDANDSACELFGYSRDELLAVRATDLSAEPEKSRAVVAAWRAGQMAKVPLRRALRKDGTVFPAELSLCHFELQGRRLLYVAYRDISARVKADAEMQEAQERILQAEVEKKRFYREMIRVVTRDKLHLVDPEQIPIEGETIRDIPIDRPESARALRGDLRKEAAERGMAPERSADFVLAVSEAATNALKHAAGGHCTLYADEERLAARVSDRGHGIRPEDIPATVLLPGYSTKVSLGMGYALMLELADAIWLATGPGGTVVQLAKWLQPPPAAAPSLPGQWDQL